MGVMSAAGVTLEFDDRVLTHLQVVIIQRFRRGESFALSWVTDVLDGSGRGSLWLTPSAPIFFRFDSTRVPPVDKAWVEALLSSSGSARGLVVVDPEGTPVHPGRHSSHAFTSQIGR